MPWLDEKKMAAWLSLVTFLIRLPNALDGPLRRDAGLSHFEYQTLAALSIAENRSLRVTDIAEFAQSSVVRFSLACTRLEGHGWITRRPDPDDERATIATLTVDGQNKIVDTTPSHVRAVRQLVFDPRFGTLLACTGSQATFRDDAPGTPRAAPTSAVH